MKTCIFITGTNCTGKTTLAKALIERFGGSKTSTKELTICNDERVTLAGRYASETTYCGVDAMNQTKTLAGIVEKALKTADVVICEGSYLLSAMKGCGLYKFTFRTPIAEKAQGFWLHIGANIVDVKDNDYEMEITIEK